MNMTIWHDYEDDVSSIYMYHWILEFIDRYCKGERQKLQFWELIMPNDTPRVRFMTNMMMKINDDDIQQNSMGGQSCRSSSSYIEDDRPEQLTTTAILDPIKMVVEAEEEVDFYSGWWFFRW